MAGRPKRRAMLDMIEASGGSEAIIAAVASGETLASLAKGLSEAMGEPCSRGMLSAWINSDPARREALAHARETAADALADEAVDIARGTTEGNSKANALKVKALQWQASKLNKAQYGDAPLVAMQFSASELHLDALRRVNANPPPKPIDAATVAAIDGASG